jgi:hypothetical protein
MKSSSKYDTDNTGSDNPEYTTAEDSRDEETRELLSLFNYADEYRQEFEPQVLTAWQNYNGYKTPVEGRSNLHIPRTYELLDTLRAQIVQAMTQSRPYIEFAPQFKRIEDLQRVEDLEKMAELAAGLVDNQLEKNGWEGKIYDFVTDYLVFPVAIMAVGWRLDIETVRRKIPYQPNVLEGILNYIKGIETKAYEVVETEEAVWDDNELQNIDFFDFWPDPRAVECNVDNCRFAFVREWMTWEDLQEYLDVLREHSDGTVFDLDREDIAQNGFTDTETAEEKKRSAIGRSFDDRDGSESMNDKRLELFEVLHYWERGKHAVLVNRYSLAYTGPNPYWHQKIPVAVACYEPLRGQFYGKSGADVLEHLQAELNTTRNQRVDNVSLIINRMWIRTDPNIPDSALVSRPNNIIDSAMPNGINPVDTPDVTASAYQEEDIVKADMETALPTPPITRGVGKEKLATNAMINNQNANTRYGVKLTLMERMGLKRIAYLMDLNNQQYIEEPRLAKFADQEGAAAWRMVDPADTYGEHDYRPASANIDPALNKEVKRQQLTELYPMIAQDRFIDQYKFRKLLLKSFDKDFLEILRPREEVEAEMQQEKQLALMQMQQQAQTAQQQGQMAQEQHEMDMAQKTIGAIGQVDDLLTRGDDSGDSKGSGVSKGSNPQKRRE